MSDRNIVPISFAALTTTTKIVAGPARLMGWGIKETTGAATAACDVYDGSDATGQLAVPFTLLSNESVRDWLGPNGLLCVRGLFVNVTSGSVSGALWVEILPADAAYDPLAPAQRIEL